MADDPLRRPDFLIIGAKRSGTSWVFSNLRRHPSVFARDKEIHYFDHQFHEGPDWYLDHFVGAGNDQVTGEATQTYMFDPAIPERMAGLAPDARLIAILRNPIDRAHSDYSYAVARGLETLTFDEAIERESERVAASYEDFLAKSYVGRGFYADQLKNVERWYPRDQILVLIFEEMVNAPVAELGRICRFLGIDSAAQPPPLSSRVNPTLRYRSQRVRNMTSGRTGLLFRAVARLNQVRDDYPAMSEAARAHLADVYGEPNRQVENWLGRSIEPWRDPEGQTTH